MSQENMNQDRVRDFLDTLKDVEKAICKAEQSGYRAEEPVDRGPYRESKSR